jgi:hypothetical protein
MSEADEIELLLKEAEETEGKRFPSRFDKMMQQLERELDEFTSDMRDAIDEETDEIIEIADTPSFRRRNDW